MLFWEMCGFVHNFVRKRMTSMTMVSHKPHFPATFVLLPQMAERRRAAFYLAAEEYIAEIFPMGSYFFTWQVGPTVVMGRNQVAHQEVDIDFCRRQGIDVIRRRSGGGAIFADEGNIMTSLIADSAPVESLFREYAEAVANALRTLGAPARVSGRNDIVLDALGCSGNNPLTLGQEPLDVNDVTSRKVCGNAFYLLRERCIAHGTMLYDTNPSLMEGALNPDDTKLRQRGIRSVRSRVGLLRDYLPGMTTSLIQEQLRVLLCDKCVELSESDVIAISQKEQRYYDPEFLFSSAGRADFIRSARFPGCGNVEVRFRLVGSLIREVCVSGDYFSLGDVDEAFRTAFIGCPFSPDNLRLAVAEHHPERTIRGLEKASLLSILINS